MSDITNNFNKLIKEITNQIVESEVIKKQENLKDKLVKLIDEIKADSEEKIIEFENKLNEIFDNNEDIKELESIKNTLHELIEEIRSTFSNRIRKLENKFSVLFNTSASLVNNTKELKNDLSNIKDVVVEHKNKNDEKLLDIKKVIKKLGRRISGYGVAIIFFLISIILLILNFSL